jgi:hypothetical protein
MKLKEFMENLNEFIKENPDVLEFDVVYTESEDELVYNIEDKPKIGHTDNRFFYDNEFKLNAVCIN